MKALHAITCLFGRGISVLTKSHRSRSTTSAACPLQSNTAKATNTANQAQALATVDVFLVNTRKDFRVQEMKVRVLGPMRNGGTDNILAPWLDTMLVLRAGWQRATGPDVHPIFIGAATHFGDRNILYGLSSLHA